MATLTQDNFLAELCAFEQAHGRCWHAAAFLAKRACGRLVFEDQADWLELFHNRVLGKNAIMGKSLVNLCSALLWGVNKEKKGYRLAKAWNWTKKTFSKPEDVQDVEGFKAVLRELKIARKDCGEATEKACARFLQPKKPADEPKSFSQILEAMAKKADKAVVDADLLKAWVAAGEKILQTTLDAASKAA